MHSDKMSCSYCEDTKDELYDGRKEAGNHPIKPKKIQIIFLLKDFPQIINLQILRKEMNEEMTGFYPTRTKLFVF